MKKYIQPKADLEYIQANDVMTASVNITIGTNDDCLYTDWTQAFGS